MTSIISVEQVNQFLSKAFEGREGIESPVVALMESGRAVVRLNVNQNHIRPGGYINGPTQMGLADQAAYAAIFTRLGIIPMAVTSNLTINFLSSIWIMQVVFF